MSSLIYGFVVVAWLIVNIDDQAQHILFASIEKCQIAEQVMRKNWPRVWAVKINCFPTGEHAIKR